MRAISFHLFIEIFVVETILYDWRRYGWMVWWRVFDPPERGTAPSPHRQSGLDL
jgi:hypothetical protein